MVLIVFAALGLVADIPFRHLSARLGLTYARGECGVATVPGPRTVCTTGRTDVVSDCGVRSVVRLLSPYHVPFVLPDRGSS
ncbi:hypothetical protein GWI33_009037 [Rhynchophorus ferrugineus]|uniref:Uncharacterized protein n=1 Tax=Rhynchophorus ferrugineus TaxID=354439 RepID=A0A834MFH3_RHYFE|nr:hypothetical protein GWI33_009037 [Rhynchophorus ferrugineus]